MGRLFWKFFLSILLAQLAATVGIGGAFWVLRENARAQPRPDIDLSPTAQLTIESAAATLEFGGPDALRRLLSGMERRRVMAVDENGRDLLGREVKPAMLAEAKALLAQPERHRVVRSMDAADGHHYLLFLPSFEQRLRAAREQPSEGEAPSDAARAPAPDGAHGPPQPYGQRAARHAGGTGIDLRAMAALRAGFAPFDPRYLNIVTVAGAIVASLLFAFLLAWYFSRPIRSLRLAFEAASRGDLAPRFGGPGGHAKGGDDLNDLGRDYDRMASRLRTLIDAQTRLLHDVSHELRSPLARLQAAIGLAHQQPDKMQASFERIERESVRMDKLVGELLTLSRLEAGALKQAGEDVSVAELVEEIIGDASFEASAHNRDITVMGEAGPHTDVVVRGQADLLGRAIENVVRNAIKHSPDGGVVRIELDMADDRGAGKAAENRLRIRVLDRGPGVAPVDLQAIFEPFYRGASKDTDGHGLGLAIARNVVESHGGGIVAHNREGGGLMVEIVLPASQRKPA